MSTVTSIYFNQHQTPSGKSRVYRVTQLRTDGVHCQESVGTGPVVLKVVPVTGAALASPRTKYYCAPSFSHTHYWYKVSMFKLSGVYQNSSTAGLLCGTVFPPRLMTSTGVKSPVYTVQSTVVFQDIISSVILLYYGPVLFSRLMLVQDVKSLVYTVPFHLLHFKI